MLNLKKSTVIAVILIIFIFIPSGCSYKVNNGKLNLKEIEKLCEDKKYNEAYESLKLAVKNDKEYIYYIEDDPELDPLKNYFKFRDLFNKLI